MPVISENDYEKTVALDIDFSKKELTVLKTVIIEQVQALPETEKESIAKKIAEFLSEKLSDITITNPKELSMFLVEHFPLVKPLIELCNYVRGEMGEKASVRLKLDKEEYDESNYAHPVLYIKTNEMDRDMRQKIRNLGSQFREPFMDEGVSFGCRPDLT